MKDDDDKGYVVLGPEIDGGCKALRFDKDGVEPGRLYRDLESVPEGEVVSAEVHLERVAGPLHRIISEKPVGRPALVNSRSYREHWDNIFGGKSVVGEA